MNGSKRLHFRSALIGGLVAAVVVTAAPAAAGAVASLLLGQTNSVDASTRLTGEVSSSNFRIINTADDGTALRLDVEPGNPPMRVDSSTKVKNLNADKLDGKSAGAFMKKAAYDPDRDGVVSNSDLLDGIDSSGFVSATEDTFYYVPGSMLEIHYDDGPATVLYDNSSDAIVRKAGTTGDMWVLIPVPLPAELGGEWGKLVNFRVSYRVDNANSYIDFTSLVKSNNTGGHVYLTTDFTDRKSTTYTSYVIDCDDPACQLDWVPNGNYLTVLFGLQYGGIGSAHDITIGGVLMRVSYDG